MSSTQVTGNQIKDGTITRNDLNITTTGLAVIRRLLATAGIAINSSTGIDSGTGDVTISADLTFLNTKYFVKADAVGQNLVLAGPTSGGGPATFRALTAGDIPTLPLDLRYHVNSPAAIYNSAGLNAITYPINSWVGGGDGLYGGDHAGGFISAGFFPNNGLSQLQIYGTYYEGGITDGSSLYFRNKNANYNTAADGWLPWYKVVVEGSNSYIKNQYAGAQSANIWVSGNSKAVSHVFADNSYFTGGSDAVYLLDWFSSARGLKVGNLVISDTYGDTAPNNGLSVKGASYLIGGIYTNTIYPYSGTSLTIGASSTVTTMNGQYNIVGNLAVSGGNITVNALASGSATRAVFATPSGVLTLGDVTSGTYTPTSSITPTGTATPSGFTFMRVGNVVHVSGLLTCSGQTAGISTISVSLPIASNLSAASDLLGVVSGNGISGSSPNYVNGNAATDSALVTFFAGSGTISVYVQFQYQVL